MQSITAADCKSCVYRVTDASSSTDCDTTGGGTYSILCGSKTKDGAAWAWAPISAHLISTVTLCQSGCDYDDLSDALAYVATQTPTWSSPWEVLIPHDLSLNLVEQQAMTVPDYTSVRCSVAGAGTQTVSGGCTILAGIPFTAGSFLSLGEHSSLQGLYITSQIMGDQTGEVVLVDMTDDFALVDECTIEAQGDTTGQSLVGIQIDGDSTVRHTAVVISGVDESQTVGIRSIGIDQQVVQDLDVWKKTPGAAQAGILVASATVDLWLHDVSMSNVDSDGGGGSLTAAIDNSIGSPYVRAAGLSTVDPIVGSVLIEDSATPTMPGRVLSPERAVTVCSSGCQYATVASALAYVSSQSPAAATPWLVQIYPGQYTEGALSVPAYTDVVGVSSMQPGSSSEQRSVQVQMSGVTAGTWITVGDRSSLRDLALYVPSGLTVTADLYLIGSTSKYWAIDGLSIKAYATDPSPYKLVAISGSYASNGSVYRLRDTSIAFQGGLSWNAQAIAIGAYGRGRIYVSETSTTLKETGYEADGSKAKVYDLGGNQITDGTNPNIAVNGGVIYWSDQATVSDPGEVLGTSDGGAAVPVQTGAIPTCDPAYGRGLTEDQTGDLCYCDTTAWRLVYGAGPCA